VLDGASRFYGSSEASIAALEGVSLRIAQGAFACMVGPSGSGKSTCLNVIGGLDSVSAGSYRFGGSEVSRLDAAGRARLRRHVGFVFQSFNLLPRMSALENVELPLVYRGVTRADRRDAAMAALRRMGLEDRASHRPSQLSGGQQQRVAIARAVVTRPRLLLADEPTGNLDTKLSGEILSLLRELNRELGMTVVMSTHDRSLIAEGDQLLEFRDGRIVSHVR
jgi:putative ABC transport system ATP-binding protein